MPYLANDHLIEPLQTTLLKDREHPIVTNLELVAIHLGQCQLRLLLLIQTLIVLRAGLLLDLLRLLCCGVVAQN